MPAPSTTTSNQPDDNLIHSHHSRNRSRSSIGARSNGAYSPVRDSQKMSDSATSNPAISPAPHRSNEDAEGSDAPKKDFQRSFKACDGCRTKKVKCELGDLAAPSEPPCARCRREMKPCLFTMSTRGRGPKARSSRSHIFGAHHLAKNPRTSSAPQDDDEDDERAASAIDALAGAALAALPATNPRLHSARHDVPVSALDPSDAPSIGMIYGLNRQEAASQQRAMHPHKKRKLSSHTVTAQESGTIGSAMLDEPTSSNDQTRSASPVNPAITSASQMSQLARPDTLQQYAEVGLQHSKDALRVLAGVAVGSRDSADDHDASRDSTEEEDPSAVNTDGRGKGDASAATQATGQHGDNGLAAILASNQRASSSARRSAAALLSRPLTPPPLKHNYGWSKFEPIRLKLVKKSEARYFLNFFIRQMHSFAPHCSPHLLDKSPEALSELVCREPILLGAMLSVASRYDVINHNAHVTAVDTFHRKISKWTQEKISRSFFLPASHTIGTIEALLILSEWATLDLHDRRTSPDASSDSEDEEDGADDNESLSDDDDHDHASTTSPAAATGDDLRSEHEGQIPKARGPSKPRRNPKAPHKPRQADMRESEKFDDTAWMLTGTALRLAERLDLHNDATYSGISSRNVASRRNAERRMRVWMSSVHADCHLSVRLGRRISSPGLAAPFMNLVRDRTHPFLLNSDMSTSTGSNETGFPSGSNRAWISFRAHSELLQIVFRTCENLYRSKAVTERLLEDEDFVPALKSIRDDLDNWANWTQPRIEPTRDMTSLRIRVEYHYARLYANGIALDSVKRSLTTLRTQRQYRASEAAEIGSKGRVGKSNMLGSPAYTVSFSTHPAYPFVREALAAAQSLIRILTVELESMMCAPARWFLLLVMAAVFCVKATAVSDAILPLKRCAQSLQQVITALERAAPDGVHLANRYSMYLRQLAKQLVLTDAKTRGAGSSSAQAIRNKTRTNSTNQREGGASKQTGEVSSATGPYPRDRPSHSGQSQEVSTSGQDVSATTPASAIPGTSAPITLGGGPLAQSIPSPLTVAGSKQANPGSGSGMNWPTMAPPIQSTSTSGSGWWSTADILPGEVDPQLFLQWLDDQTLSTAPPTSHHPMSSWANDSISSQPNLANNAAHHLHQRLSVGATGTSPQAGQGRSPSTESNNTNPSLGSQHLSSSNIYGHNQMQAQQAPLIPNPSGPPQQHLARQGHNAMDMGGQEDLLTKMWLDDALTDLANAGLDMPFL